jgi:hypothetical protein
MSKARDLAGLFNLGSRSGTTAQRPATAEVGDIYYNGTTGKTEIYTTTGWKEMASGIAFGNSAARPASPTVGTPYFNGEEKRLELYTSSGWQNIVSETPGVVSVSGNYLESTGSATLEVTGTNFTTGAIASVIGTNGVEVNANSTTVNSIVSVSAVFSGLSNANEPYDLKITNTSNLFGLLPDALYINASPVWQTASGSLGSFAEQVAMSVSATATDDSTITYALAAGSSLPSGVTLNSATGLISGTLPNISTNTIYTFTINASDGSNPVIPRTFSFISNAAPAWVTASGSLGSFLNNTSITTSALSVTDTDTVNYTLASGSSLPSGLTLNSSTGVISGTLPVVSSDTTYTFTINANDGLNVVPREFSISSNIIVSAEYLVVAGGGGGGLGNGSYREGGGGGGAGGYKTGTLTFAPSTQYTLAVGAKGIGKVTGSTGYGTNGGDSILATITSTGGGGGAPHDTSGLAGGSGGGAGCQGSSGGNASPAGQGNAGGAGYQGSAAGAGGGGGAGGAGSSGTSAGGGAGGAGGAGISSSISGSAFLYAAGGGGGAHVTSGAAGGIGAGRGGGQQTGVAPTAASDNTGSGGGGGTDNTKPGQDGGSGVVILKYPSNKTLTLSGTLVSTTSTAVAGYKVTTFTAGSGTVTF